MARLIDADELIAEFWNDTVGWTTRKKLKI